MMDIPLDNATAAVVGATGAIGRVCAELLAGDVGRLILIARDGPDSKNCATACRRHARAELVVSTNMHSPSRGDS